MYGFKSQLLRQIKPYNEIKIVMIDESIFREYDVRGIVPSQINERSINAIASSIAKKCSYEKVSELAIGRDGRLSGQDLLNSLSI